MENWYIILSIRLPNPDYEIQSLGKGQLELVNKNTKVDLMYKKVVQQENFTETHMAEDIFFRKIFRLE